MQMASNEQQPTRRRPTPTWTLPAGRHADERWRSIDLRATAFGGLVLVTAVIAGFVWELAHGRSGDPYAPLGAIAGFSYLIALIWFRWRS